MLGHLLLKQLALYMLRLITIEYRVLTPELCTTSLIGVYIKIEPRGQRLARTLAPPVSPLPSTDWLGSVGRP